MFVNTNCTSNERVVQGQDPRYYSLVALEDINDYEVSINVSISEFQPFPPKFQKQDPVGDETCFRACLCGYTLVFNFGGVDIPGTPLAPYQVCNGSQILGDYYSDPVDVSNPSNPIGIPNVIYLTSANMTFLKYYGGLPCDAQVGQSGNFTETFYIGLGVAHDAVRPQWVWVPENDSMMVPASNLPPDVSENTSIADVVIKNNYECFDSFDNMQSIMLTYINQSYDGLLDRKPQGACDD